MGRMTVISGAERRRRWSDEDRARILAAISEPGAVIAEVARREDVCTSLVFKWRREMREAVEADAGGFAPVVIEPAPAFALLVDIIELGFRRHRGGVERCARAHPRRRANVGDRGGFEGAAAMIPIPSGCRVWIAMGHTDMRRGMQGLALQVQEQLKRDPHAGDLYVFRGRRGDLAKILWHDGVGLSLYAKRLDRGKFVWPSAKDGVVSISASQMACMLEGIDWRNPQLTWRPTSAG